MKKIYDKNETNFALIWIGLYVVLLSVGDNISASLGIAKSVTAPICIVLTAYLYLWISKYDLKEKYGLCAFKGSPKQYLYFIPLLLLASTNVWYGLKLNLSVTESVLYVISMLCVGFLEEVIFRGLLFKALCATNVKSAIIISSVTFGMGHIVNLLNGSAIFETCLQICYAIAIGFLFTIIFYKGKGLWPCIIAHGVINSLSCFSNTNARNMTGDIVGAVFICIVSIAYTLYILHVTKEK